MTKPNKAEKGHIKELLMPFVQEKCVGLSTEQYDELRNKLGGREYAKSKDQEASAFAFGQSLWTHGVTEDENLVFAFSTNDYDKLDEIVTKMVEVREVEAIKRKEAQAAAAANGRKQPGPKRSEYAGCSIFPATEENKNPRRENTFGWRSFEIVRANPGIVYEEYVKAGGRSNDLKWDLNKGFARIELNQTSDVGDE